MIRRRELLAAPLALGAVEPARAATADESAPAPALKVLRYAFVAAETGFDPAKLNDLYSRIATAHMFEAPYRYDYLARPVKVVPHTAEAMPEASDDFRTFTVRIKPGIYFTPDAAFRGKPRELVAADYVYSWKRFFDPVTKSPNYSQYREAGALGCEELRRDALRTGKFDYDREIPGVRALDRYTVQWTLAETRPRFVYMLADSGRFGALAREVCELYGTRIDEHPVGTGAFRLAEWRRSSKLVFVRNPDYRELRFDGQPADDDAHGQELLREFKGRKLPLVDRVEISIVEESQPRWLTFLSGGFDLINVPVEFCGEAVGTGKLAPYLARRGIGLDRYASPDRTYFFFNMEDPLVGGYTADKVALRRAVSLATNVDAEIRNVRRGQAIAAQSDIAPGSYGYDPHLRTENGIYDPARAKALLDLYGYVDRDGDGWREQPNGAPLELVYATTPSAISRQFDELWKKNMDAIGIRLRYRTAQWPEQLKAAKAGQLMIWQLGNSNTEPDFQEALQELYGPAAGGQNLSRFKSPEVDALFRRMQALPDGPERLEALRKTIELIVAYMPFRSLVHRVDNYLSQPRVRGFRFPLFGNQFWQYVDIDDTRSTAKVA